MAYNLIQSYLQNRQQFVSINQCQSDLKPIFCGLLQSLSLDPLFFLIYIIDLNNALVSKPRLFADGTCLLVKELNPEQLQIKINRERQNLHLLCSANKLSVNPTKTNIIITPPKQTRVQIPHFNLTNNGSPVTIVSNAKHLGVIIDNDFNF